MIVLFVRSGNNGIDSISTLQGKSLENRGATVKYFDIIGKGMRGYLKNIVKLRQHIKDTDPDLIHAH